MMVSHTGIFAVLHNLGERLTLRGTGRRSRRREVEMLDSISLRGAPLSPSSARCSNLEYISIVPFCRSRQPVREWAVRTIQGE